MSNNPVDPSVPVRPADVAELTKLLAQYGIDAERWQHPASNDVRDLFRELNHGECRLYLQPIRRELSIARIWIRRGGLVLIEKEIEETPGRRQARRRLPSEKFLPDETPEAAARRGLCEELGCTADAIQSINFLTTTPISRPTAASYPGLRSDYIVHDVACVVTGLPETAFETVENDVPGGKVVIHRWDWAAPVGLEI